MFDEQKPSEHELAPELIGLEQHLRSLTPAAPHIDRDRLMFAAGVAAATEPGRDGRAIYLADQSWTRRRIWPVATAMMTAATLLLATMLVWQNRSQSVARLTTNPQPAIEVVSAPSTADGNQFNRVATRAVWSTIPNASSGYLGIRYIALTRDVDDFLPDFQSSGGNRDRSSDDDRTEPATAHNLLDEFLPVPTQSNHSRS